MSNMSNFERDYQLILQATIDNSRMLIKNSLPTGIERDFLLWILDDNNSHRISYFQTTGVSKTTELMVSLLEEFIDRIHVTENFFSYLGVLNTYLSYEVISDNLAIGLAVPQKNDLTFAIRQKILLKFNNVMQQKLNGDKTETLTLLQTEADQVKLISGYKQSLGENKLRQYAQAYCSQRPDLQTDDLEHNILAMLVLNIQSCIYMTTLMSKHAISEPLRKSLSERYSAINDLLAMNRTKVSLEKLANYGAKTILVEPTLLFVIGALDSIEPNTNLVSVINNRLLIKALEGASCIVRLLNDMGTPLLSLPQSEIIKFQDELYDLCQKDAEHNSQKTFFEFLETISKTNHFFTSLTRIRKDIKHGEFNVCLHNLKYIKNIREGIDFFCENLQFYSELYQQQRNNLNHLLQEMNNSLKDEKVSQVILKFVIFHEKLYTRDYESSIGEYAIPSLKD